VSVLQNQSGTIPASTTGGPSQAISIVSSTDTTPIHLTVTPAQTWALDGETVHVEGHKTNLNANGDWQAAIVDSTEIVLLGTIATGAGAGGATGVVYDYNTTPACAMPNNGDLATGPSVATAVTAPLNMAPYLLSRVGKYRLFNKGGVEGLGSIGTSWSTNAAVAAGGGDVNLASTGGVVAASLGGPLLVYQGDIVHARWSISGLFSCGGTTALQTLQLGISLNGAAYSGTGLLYRPGHVLPRLNSDTNTSNVYSFAMIIDETFAVPSAWAALPGTQTAGCTLDFNLIARNYESSQTVSIDLVGDYSFQVEQFRSNG
jgi:hypothetical protein